MNSKINRSEVKFCVPGIPGDCKILCTDTLAASPMLLFCRCCTMNFDMLGETANVETIAAGSSICELPRLEKLYGRGKWRKMKGEATIRLPNARVVRAEIHWYEAHGIGRKEFKRKRYLD
jgi:hypothetical protein